MKDHIGPPRKLGQVGRVVIENGFDAIAIKYATKRPLEDDWVNKPLTDKRIEQLLTTGPANLGLGILAENFPAVDIDSSNSALVEKLVAYIDKKHDLSPLRRTGQAPKTLFVYRTDTPFKKVTSRRWNGDGGTHQVEVLGSGQQYVAFGIHPKTQKPYLWEFDDPSTEWADNLPELTEAIARDIAQAFDNLCEMEGYTTGSKSSLSAKRQTVVNDDWDDDDDDDNVMEHALRIRPLELSTGEVKAYLKLIKNDGDGVDYEEWREMGMALWHQFKGSDIGLKIFIDWSRQSDRHGQSGEDKRGQGVKAGDRYCATKWKSFEISMNDRRDPITFRTIIKKADEAESAETSEIAQDLTKRADMAESMGELKKVSKASRKSKMTVSLRQRLAETMANRKVAIECRLIGKPPKRATKEEINIMFTSISPVSNDKNVPEWLSDLVFDMKSERIYDSRDVVDMPHRTASTVYADKIASLNNALGLKLKNVIEAMMWADRPGVMGVVYHPCKEKIFEENGALYLNAYQPHLVPNEIDDDSAEGEHYVNTIKQHLENIIPDQKTRTTVIDWLAYCVQNPGRKINFAILLKGTEGDGKSSLLEMMRGVMGERNVKSVKSQILNSDFNAWASGSCLVAIEEIRIIGHSRYDVTNNLKEIITNKRITYHSKGKDSVEIDNVTNYLIFTNHDDAMPVDDNDRRYMMIKTPFNSRAKLEAFMSDKPDYFENLYGAIENGAGYIRNWLINHEISAEFNPKGMAPQTAFKAEMARNTKHEAMSVLMDAINDRESFGFWDDMVSISHLQAECDSANVPAVSNRKMAQVLAREGYTESVRIRLQMPIELGINKSDNKYVIYYNPDKVLDSSVSAVKDIMQNRVYEFDPGFKEAIDDAENYFG